MEKLIVVAYLVLIRDSGNMVGQSFEIKVERTLVLKIVEMESSLSFFIEQLDILYILRSYSENKDTECSKRSIEEQMEGQF